MHSHNRVAILKNILYFETVKSILFDSGHIGDYMPTKSFYEDLVIDTLDAAKNFTEMIEENKPYHPLGKEYVLDDPETIRFFIAKSNH